MPSETKTILISFFYRKQKIRFKANINTMFMLDLCLYGGPKTKVKDLPLVKIIPVRPEDKPSHGSVKRKYVKTFIRGCPSCFFVWESGTSYRLAKCPRCGEINNGPTTKKRDYMQRQKEVR